MESIGSSESNGRASRAVERPGGPATKVLIAAGTVAAVVFLLDISLPLGDIGGVLYVGAVAICSWSPRRSFPILVATVCTLLTVLDYFLSQSGASLWVVLLSRAYSVSAIWITTGLVMRRVRSEEALGRSEMRYRSLIETIPHGVLESDASGIITFSNPAHDRMYGYPNGELMGKTIWNVLDSLPERENLGEQLASHARELPRPIPYMTRDKTLDGRAIDVQVDWGYKRDALGRVNGMVSVLTDVTERNKAEAKLREAEEEWRRTFDSMADYVSIHDTSGTILKANRALEELLAIPGAKLSGMNYLAAPRDTGQPDSDCPIMASVQSKKEESREYYDTHLERWLQVSACPVFDDSGQVTRVVRVARDITKRKLSEEALRLTQFSIDSARDFVFWIGPDAHFLYVNDAACQTLGYTREELLSMTVHDVVPDSDAEQWPEHWRQIRKRGSQTIESHHQTKSGRIFPVEVTVNHLKFNDKEYFCAFVRDVTNRKNLQDQLLQAQKMEAVGTLAGGVAHDFNNLLSAVMGYCQLGLTRVEPEDPLHGYLQEIQKAGNRAADLTRQLLAFSRRQIIDPTVVNLSELILDMDKMLRRVIGENIELVTIPSANLGMIKVDHGQMEQVLVNLAINARDAMHAGGKLVIESANVTLNRRSAERHPNLTPGDFVMFAVRDTGTGMTPETKARIFEPFFTTKEKGKGTGLGLSACHGIIEQNGGHITVDSEPGRGTTFRVYLPRVEEDADVSPLRDTAEHLPQGNEVVLLAEDEPSVRRMISSVLREQGYTVLEAGNGHEPLLTAAEHTGEQIHLLLTDVVMPLMGGTMLARRLRDSHPETRVLYTSGYADETIVESGVLDADTTFVQKPFSPGVLARAVREVLDKS